MVGCGTGGVVRRPVCGGRPPATVKPKPVPNCPETSAGPDPPAPAIGCVPVVSRETSSAYPLPRLGRPDSGPPYEELLCTVPPLSDVDSRHPPTPCGPGCRSRDARPAYGDDTDKAMGVSGHASSDTRRRSSQTEQSRSRPAAAPTVRARLNPRPSTSGSAATRSPANVDLAQSRMDGRDAVCVGSRAPTRSPTTADPRRRWSLPPDNRNCGRHVENAFATSSQHRLATTETRDRIPVRGHLVRHRLPLERQELAAHFRQRKAPHGQPIQWGHRPGRHDVGSRKA